MRGRGSIVSSFLITNATASGEWESVHLDRLDAAERERILADLFREDENDCE
jgi:hypothetical protein